MNSLRSTCLILLTVLINFHLSFGQVNYEDSFSIGINRNYPPLSIESKDIQTAQTLLDLNKNFESTWIKKYLSVQTFATINDEQIVIDSRDMTLSEAQRNVITAADSGTDIRVKVKYMPDNDLAQNEPKELSFSFIVEAEKPAHFPGGADEMKKYLDRNVADKISKDKFNKYQLAVIQFSIDEEGLVIDPVVFWSSDDKEIDAILKAAVCNMPKWSPASYKNGDKAKQEFVLTVGDMTSCVTPMLGVRPNRF